MSDPRLLQILHHLDPPAGTRLWHGGGKVLGVLRGVSPDKAAWEPGPERHSIWALTLHMAYWKYIVHRKIVDGPKGGFPRAPSNWPSVPSETSLLPASTRSRRGARGITAAPIFSWESRCTMSTIWPRSSC